MTKAKERKSETTSTPVNEDEYEMTRTKRTESEIENLLTPAEVKNLLNELDRERSLRVRALADFDNYRKRVERERSSAALSGKRAVLLSFLEVMDDFDRALGHAGQAPDAIVAGLRAIHKRMADTIKSHGVTQIEAVGREFDPALHEAVGVIDAGNGKTGLVIDEVSPGYFWNGEVLRPARVRVSK
jgi:molecular chaperone GrpE